MNHNYMVMHCSFCCTDTIHYTWKRKTKENGFVEANYRCAVCGTVGSYSRKKHPALIVVSKEQTSQVTHDSRSQEEE